MADSSVIIITESKLWCLFTLQSSGSLMPVEVPTIPGYQKPLAVCVSVAHQPLDPVRLVEWLEFQRLLGASLIGVYLASDVNQQAKNVFRYYADVEGWSIYADLTISVEMSTERRQVQVNIICIHRQ